MFGVAGAVVGSQPKERVTSVILDAELNIEYINSQNENSSIIFKYKTLPGDWMPSRMKNLADTAQQILLKDKIPAAGTIQL